MAHVTLLQGPRGTSSRDSNWFKERNFLDVGQQGRVIHQSLRTQLLQQRYYLVDSSAPYHLATCTKFTEEGRHPPEAQDTSFAEYITNEPVYYHETTPVGHNISSSGDGYLKMIWNSSSYQTCRGADLSFAPIMTQHMYDHGRGSLRIYARATASKLFGRDCVCVYESNHGFVRSTLWIMHFMLGHRVCPVTCGVLVYRIFPDFWG